MRVLDAVAHTGAISKAAHSLGMTGPAVSQQIRRLEAEARVKIVEPAGRGIRLTPDGAELAKFASQMAEVMQQADNMIHRAEPLAGVIRMGGVASALRTVVATELARMRTEHPAVTVLLEDGEAVDHVQRLADGHLDLVIAESWSPNPVRLPPGLRCDTLSAEAAYIALPAGHPHSGDTAIDIRDLTDDAWATCATGSDGHIALIQTAHAHGVELHVRFHVADHLTQIELVRAGVAVACVPSSASRHADARTVTLLPLAAPLHRELLLVTPRSIASRATAHLASRLATPD